MTEWLVLTREWLRPLADTAGALLPPDSPPARIVTAGCILLLLLILGRTPARSGLVRYTHFLAAAVAVFALLLAVYAVLPDSAWVVAGIWPVALLLAGGFLGKLALASHFAALRDARHDPRGRLAYPLLPFQERALQRIVEHVRLAPTPLVLGVQASWGAGKSMIMDYLSMALNAHAGRYVAVRVNVWEYEDYNDLQFGAMQALLAHPRVLESYGWMDYPLWMLVREWGGLRFRAFQLGWGDSKADADGDLHLPWQTRFERIVARQHLAGRRIVFVLDEIDRASAPATQAALTMLTRSLALPGVTSVVPFVEEVIRFKAFHPGVVVLDDLRDTVSALLHDEWLRTERAAMPQPGANAGPHQMLTPGSLPTYQVLADRFMRRASATAWVDYYVRMEERYLRQRIHLGKLGGDDLVALLRLPEIAALFAGFGADKYRELLEWTEQQAAVENSPLRDIKTQVRWLKGDLMKLLSAPVAPDIDPRFILVLALAMGR